jgi:predicted secreted protein
MTRLVLCLLLLTLVVDGCGEEAPREGGAGEAGPPTPAPSTITEADNGESFTLAPGSETSLRLSGKYVWREPTVRGDAVQLTRVDYFQDPGFSEWTVLAVEPGTATIAAHGTPDCAGQEPCPDEPLRFELELTVAR